jgi:hypothetical protein
VVEMVYYLIENNAHIVMSFDTLKKLKEYAKQHNLKIKKSWACDWGDPTYYTESYEILPTGEAD